MAKATSKAGFGSGWHKQSGRHSNAAKYGTAGGAYKDYHIYNVGNKSRSIFAFGKDQIILAKEIMRVQGASPKVIRKMTIPEYNAEMRRDLVPRYVKGALITKKKFNKIRQRYEKEYGYLRR